MLKVLFAGLIGLGCLFSPILETPAQAQTRVVAVEYCAPEAPPIARVETVVVRPGFLWSRGHWFWNGGSWVWIPGRHIAIRYNHVWVHPGYVVRGHRWIFVRGHWV